MDKQLFRYYQDTIYKSCKVVIKNIEITLHYLLEFVDLKLIGYVQIPNLVENRQRNFDFKIICFCRASFFNPSSPSVIFGFTGCSIYSLGVWYIQKILLKYCIHCLFYSLRWFKCLLILKLRYEYAWAMGLVCENLKLLKTFVTSCVFLK